MLCSAEMPPRHFVRWLALVAGVALLLRLVYLFEIDGTAFASVLIGDGQQYDAWARRIAAGEWIGHGVFYQAPLYPYLLGVVFAVGGHSLLAVRVLQAVLGASSCALLAVAGRRLVGDRAGLIAGMMLAVYPPAIFFDGLIQKSSLDLFLVVLLLALLGEVTGRIRASCDLAILRSCDLTVGRRDGGAIGVSRVLEPCRSPDRQTARSLDRTIARSHDLEMAPLWPWLAGAGLALGAFMLNRENARVLYPVVAAWLWLFFRETAARKRLAWLAVFTVGVAVAVVPVGLRNMYAGGEFLISTSQAGPNFYIGNHAGALGSYTPLVAGHGNAAFEQEDATRLAETAAGRRLSPGEVSDFWLARAFHDIRQAPGAWLALVGRKLLLTFNTAEVVDTESIEAYAEHSRVLGTLFWFDFGVILPLAAIGVWQSRREWKRLALLYAIAGSLALSVALFYVLARYRYPIVPVVLLLAGAALAEVPTSVRGWRGFVPGLAVAAAVALLAWLPIVPAADETNLNMGTALVSLGRPAEALPWLERASAAAPDYAAPHFNLGVAFERMGDRQKSLEEFATAVRLAPADFEAQSALALTLQESGDLAGAVAAFREAARLQPGNARAEFNLGVALRAAGLSNESVAHYEAAVRLKPDYAEAHSNLALALRESGDLSGAVDHMQAAARLQPASAAIEFNLAELLNDAGRGDEALTCYERAAALSPGSLDIQYAVAQAYGRASRWQPALDALQKAAALARAGGRTDTLPAIEAAIEACRTRLARR
jgi:tetratricopeptide (TPR) repeat protein